LCQPSNFEILYNVRIDTFGSFLEKSLFVVIPLKNILLSAGHMVLLEAMFRGKNIIITDIPSVRDYVDDDMVFFYKADDPKDLAEKIEYLYSNRNNNVVLQKARYAKSIFHKTYSFKSFLKRILSEIIEE
jgi:glycosyltransferase involved in cell wall biosynthesis